MQPLGGITRLLPNKSVPFLKQTIKEALAAKKSRRSVSSYIRKNKDSWVNWAPPEDEGTVLSAGDERVALTEQRVRQKQKEVLPSSVLCLEGRSAICSSSQRSLFAAVAALLVALAGLAEVPARQIYVYIYICI